jgi:hypothetical protein
MNIRIVGSNQTEVGTNVGIVFFSYNTPVAAKINGICYRTEKYFSNTTSKHINKWLEGRKAETRPQEFFYSLQ